MLYLDRETHFKGYLGPLTSLLVLVSLAGQWAKHLFSTQQAGVCCG